MLMNLRLCICIKKQYNIYIFKNIYAVYTTTGQKLMYHKYLNGSLSQILQK